MIFVIRVDFWLLDQYLDSGSILGNWVDFLVDFSPLVGFLDCGRIFCFLDDFCLFGQFLSLELIFGFSVNVWLLGYSWLLGRFFLSISGLWFDFWLLGQF